MRKCACPLQAASSRGWLLGKKGGLDDRPAIHAANVRTHLEIPAGGAHPADLLQGILDMALSWARSHCGGGAAMVLGMDPRFRNSALSRCLALQAKGKCYKHTHVSLCYKGWEGVCAVV